MLRSLYVRDYALIEELEVEFGSGLNIITGETGAGKSILIGALKLILGERAATDTVRSGARKAIVEGTFDADSEQISALLTENQIEAFDYLILRREIAAGQSRAFINDTPATLQLMRSVVTELVDLHGQHEHQSLLRSETHLGLLDSFGNLAPMVETYRTHFNHVRSLREQRDRLVRSERELARDKEMIAFQIDEIDRIAPQDGEEEELEKERRILEHAEFLYEATARLSDVLYESDAALYDQLVVAKDALADLVRIDPRFEASLGELHSAQIIVAELASFLQDYNSGIEFNPERLESIRERLSAFETLKRKYGGTLESVMAHREEIGRKFELAADFQGAIGRLDRQVGEAERALTAAALQLSELRREAARHVEADIGSELARLGIDHGRFEVRFTHEEAPDGPVVHAGSWPGGASIASSGVRDADHADGSAVAEPAVPRRYRAFENGADRVEYYLSTNVGEAPRPLARVASGGEVSRVMLALKSILARNERLPVLVFDEIDTGVSGSIARKVGESMHVLARSHQIIAITHLPQIAALGDRHYVVEKSADASRTRTSIRQVEGDDRAAEIAALMSGAEVTEATLVGARQLMGGNRTFSDGRSESPANGEHRG